MSLIKKAQLDGYTVTLLYFWLDAPETAYTRVAKRVSEGGHNIPLDVIQRRYYRGIHNLVNLYIPICDKWIVVNNVSAPSKIILQGSSELGQTILNGDIWDIILKQSNDSSK